MREAFTVSESPRLTSRMSPWSHKEELLPAVTTTMAGVSLLPCLGLEILVALLVRNTGCDMEVSWSREKGTDRGALVTW